MNKLASLEATLARKSAEWLAEWITSTECNKSECVLRSLLLGGGFSSDFSFQFIVYKRSKSPVFYVHCGKRSNRVLRVRALSILILTGTFNNNVWEWVKRKVEVCSKAAPWVYNKSKTMYTMKKKVEVCSKVAPWRLGFSPWVASISQPLYLPNFALNNVYFLHNFFSAFQKKILQITKNSSLKKSSHYRLSSLFDHELPQIAN